MTDSDVEYLVRKARLEMAREASEIVLRAAALLRRPGGLLPLERRVELELQGAASEIMHVAIGRGMGGQT